MIWYRHEWFWSRPRTFSRRFPWYLVHRWRAPKQANLLQLLPIEFRYIGILMRIYASDVKLVTLCYATKLEPSWRLTAIEKRQKLARFSYIDLPLLLSTPVQRTIFWANSSSGYIQRRCLIPFPCSSCDSLLLSTIIGISNRQPLKSEVDLNETLRYSPNRQSFEQTRETFHEWATSYHILARMVFHFSDRTHIASFRPHLGDSDPPRG